MDPDLSILFFIVWSILGLIGFFTFYVGHDASFKRKYFPWFMVFIGAVFFGFVLALVGTEPLLVLSVALPLIVYLNIRCTVFCDSCGKTIHMGNWFSPAKYCPGCGAALFKQEKYIGTENARASEPDSKVPGVSPSEWSEERHGSETHLPTSRQLLLVALMVLAVVLSALFLYRDKLLRGLDNQLEDNVPKVILPTDPAAIERASEIPPDPAMLVSDRNQLIRAADAFKQNIWIRGHHAAFRVGPQFRVTEEEMGISVAYDAGDQVVHMSLEAESLGADNDMASVLEVKLKGFVTFAYTEVAFGTRYHTTTIAGQRCLLLDYAGTDAKYKSKVNGFLAVIPVNANTAVTAIVTAKSREANLDKAKSVILTMRGP
jgi:hypothetical protein